MEITHKANQLMASWASLASLNGFPNIKLPTMVKNIQLKTLPDNLRIFTVMGEKTLRILLPEGTEAIANDFLENHRNYPNPFSCSYFMRFYRHEREQANRSSEFTQAGVEILRMSEKKHIVDVYRVFYLITKYFEDLSITNYTINVNCRFIIEKYLSQFEYDLDALLRILDKGSISDLASLLKIPVQEITDQIKEMAQSEGFFPIISDLEKVFKKVVFDPSIVRGLSYYDGLIFEIKSPTINSSIGGGGSYKFTDGKKKVCYGFGVGLGIDRITSIVENTWNYSKYILLDSDDVEAINRAVEQVCSEGLNFEFIQEVKSSISWENVVKVSSFLTRKGLN